MGETYLRLLRHFHLHTVDQLRDRTLPAVKLRGLDGSMVSPRMVWLLDRGSWDCLFQHRRIEVSTKATEDTRPRR